MLMSSVHRSEAVAVATAIGHHGEILQGAFRDRHSKLHRGLLTLTFPYVRSMAVAARSSDASVALKTAGRSKALRAAQLLFDSEQRPGFGISIRLVSNIPIGFGLGSSTADVVSSIRACAKLLGRELSGTEVFRLAVEAETASDGTMFRGCARLVAHREGKVLEKLDAHLPAFGLISVNTAPDSPVDTLNFQPARYSNDELSEFDDLRALLKRAVGRSDLSLLGRVATRSAQINERFLPQPRFAEILDVATRERAIGIQVAHSGRMLGILLPPDIGKNQLKRLLGAVRDLQLLPTYFPPVSKAVKAD